MIAPTSDEAMAMNTARQSALRIKLKPSGIA